MFKHADETPITNEDTNLFLSAWIAMPARLNNGNADCSDIVIDPGPSHK